VRQALVAMLVLWVACRTHRAAEPAAQGKADAVQRKRCAKPSHLRSFAFATTGVTR